jgi:hypothetical protein
MKKTRRISSELCLQLRNKHPKRRVKAKLRGDRQEAVYIKNILNRTRDWDDDLERLQGSLLGYEDWENDWWIEQRSKGRLANQK